jgi:hypothetical protein
MMSTPMLQRFLSPPETPLFFEKKVRIGIYLDSPVEPTRVFSQEDKFSSFIIISTRSFFCC